MMCCDPPGGAIDAPVDPEKLFKYPDEDNDSYYYNVQESNNDEGKLYSLGCGMSAIEFNLPM